MKTKEVAVLRRNPKKHYRIDKATVVQDRVLDVTQRSSFGGMLRDFQKTTARETIRDKTPD